MAIEDAWREYYESTSASAPYARTSHQLPGVVGFLRYLLAEFAREHAGSERPELLDIGCSTGELTAHLAKLGFEPTGVDYSEPLVARAREAHPEVAFEVADVYELGALGRRFEYVVCLGVLQNVSDLDRALVGIRSAYRQTERSRILIVTRPTPTPLFRAVDRAIRLLPGHRAAPELREYDCHSLGRAASAAGLRMLTCERRFVLAHRLGTGLRRTLAPLLTQLSNHLVVELE